MKREQHNVKQPGSFVNEDTSDSMRQGGTRLSDSGFEFTLKPVLDSVKKCTRLTNLKTNSDLVKPAWIHFHMRHDVFTANAKRPFDLPSEYYNNNYYYNRFTGLCSGLPGWAKWIWNWFYCECESRFDNNTRVPPNRAATTSNRR